MQKTAFKMSWRDVGGAFADGAILFPLLVGLSIQAGMNGTILLGSAGLAYIVAGFVFRIPMPVQPLKSVAVAALALGATAFEISLSGFLVGLCCLALSFLPADKIAEKVPRHLIHGLQLALGILLMAQGGKWIAASDIYAQAGIVIAALCIVGLSFKSDKPVMGWLAAAGFAAGIYFALKDSGAGVAQTFSDAPLRTDIILGLVVPQMVLTLANSVIGTKDVADRYFKEQAQGVTMVKLLRIIGLGNMAFAPLGGLPFCHGSGGLTAHVKGGAVN